MRFLHPWALALGALVAIPVAVHLLRRTALDRVPFPAVRYLQTAERLHARSLRLRDSLLLATRVLLVAAVALAAAGPLVGRGAARDHAPTDVMLVVDNSASMALADGETSAFEAQLSRARATLSAAGPADRFWIVPTVGSAVAIAASPGHAEAALERIPLSDAAGLVSAAVRRVRRLLPSESGRESEIQVFTDLQATAFREEADPGGRGTPLLISRGFSLPVENGAVVALELPPGGRTSHGLAFSVAARLERFPTQQTASSSSRDSVDVRLVLDGETVGLMRGRWNSTVVFRIPGPAPGPHVGSVELPPTGLPADDRRHFTLRVAPPPAVRHIGPGGGFAARALETLRADGRIGTEAGARIVLVEGDLAAAGRLTRAEGDASLILVPPEAALELPRFNDFLASLGVGWKLRPDVARGQLRLSAPAEVAALDDVLVSQRYGLERGPGGGLDSVLVRTDDGAPWLVAGPLAAGGFTLLASPLTPAATSLPVSAAMVPFVEALVHHWSFDRTWPSRGFIAGEEIRLTAGTDSVTTPDGGAARVDAGRPYVPRRAGVHHAVADLAQAAEATAFAVNVPAGESDTRPLPPAQLERLFPGFDLRVADSTAEWAEVTFQARRGANATVPLLALALFLAVLEALLASPGGRDRIWPRLRAMRLRTRAEKELR